MMTKSHDIRVNTMSINWSNNLTKYIFKKIFFDIYLKYSCVF